ncbi:hypothetical protein MYXO_03036 [Myxococcaceae bacterium]|nr:hypothetical protein MYXO_03036 [Myxococcaceae bacterium]
MPHHVPKKLLLLLLAAGCGPAWALTPADGAPQLSLYIPGSQANDPNFGFLIGGVVPANALCLDAANTSGAGTTTHVYFQNYTGTPASATNNDYSAIYCNTDDTRIPGLTGGTGAHHTTRLWISRRRLGASFIGLDAVANGTALTYLADPVTASCTAVNGTFTSAGVAYGFNYSCTVVTPGIHATAATSDITPDVFHGSDNVTPGYSDIDATTLDNRFAIAGHIIGIPVTLKLRNALQYAGIVSGQITNTLDQTPNVACTVGSEDRGCVPSLSKEQLVSLFTGTTYDWGTFRVKVGGVEKTLPQVVADGVTAGISGLSNPLDTTVHICRRENGAGQQVALLANVLQYPCLGSSAPAIAQPGFGPADVGYATSLGAVDNCLKDYNDGTNGWFGTSNSPPYPNPPATGVPHGNQWAISIQTTERNASRGTNYRFIKINGALPTGEQVFLGHYPLVGEYGISWKTGSVAPAGSNIEKALNALVAYSQLPAVVASRNTNISKHSWGQAGYVALSANGYAPNATWNETYPVTPYTRAASGTPDACTIPIINPNYSSAELR